jgi:hypothetical protein
MLPTVPVAPALAGTALIVPFAGSIPYTSVKFACAFVTNVEGVSVVATVACAITLL